MPLIGALASKGLKFCVMLVSGDDSITSAGALEVEELLLEVEPPAAVVELELEHAARPAARRPVAVSASTLFLVILLIVDIDLSFRGYFD
jgi:hypothetical protein